MSRLLISAAHKSSGKTTVSIGLCAAFRARGTKVQPFKKGPDYIDPMWLSVASGRPCRNLDFFMMGQDEIVAEFQRHSAGADVSLIEGNKGLYDGLNLDGSNSNAALARLLQAPVVLVIDARGMTRGIAPLILGYQAFDRNINIAGVILNNLGGARHESKLRAVIEHYTDVPVIGAVHHDKRLEIVERHLGLMPSNETEAATLRVNEIGAVVGAQVDLDKLLEIAALAPRLPAPAHPSAEALTPALLPKVRIGWAKDKAFGFYYADDIDALRAAGAELVPLDTLHDPHLPEVDGLFIGGGFPELFMNELEANTTLREEIGSAIENGMPVYAECGGLMYLARSLTWHGEKRNMVGVIPGDVMMHEKPVGRGYVRLNETGENPWVTAAGPSSVTELRGHEFHYSSLDNLDTGRLKYAYEVKRGHGIDGRHDGIVYKNLLASYAHLRSLGNYNWAARFVAFVRSNAQGADKPVDGGTLRHDRAA
ncbi:hydrogenase expression protein HypE [Sulfuricella sp. T08]|uniref:cobyrinate a,c-diamide synthase n=1 Tax=Sulfuricella sp. T08 TaxID=1632857 RepID=UPI0006179AD3|nr:cobyrinate a,c-diamide synthase [Sulfuricella sp. T08]GAO36541.1 hydrogenase expression protein HypE [Sulfuricella sp. T08]